MKIGLNPIPDRQDLEYNFKQTASAINGGLDSENLKYEEISGTTDEANTQKLFRHKLGKAPSFYLPVYGNVYIAEMSNTSVDVRSIFDEEVQFKILLVR